MERAIAGGEMWKRYSEQSWMILWVFVPCVIDNDMHIIAAVSMHIMHAYIIFRAATTVSVFQATKDSKGFIILLQRAC